nr:zinc finger, CCHC-type [Tanacetum cinerariifolium]
MKGVGEANVILDIKIKRENKGIVITQSRYIKKILKKFNREDCSSVSTLMNPIEKLKPNTGKPVDQLEYSRAIGCLMGGEYYDPVFFQYVEIIHETTAPYTPQQNGVAEKKNRALKEMVNSMLSYSEAIDDEIGSIMENNTCVLSDLPPGCKPLCYKWIFKRKMKVDGIVDKFKARLVIQGFRQKERIDYFDTYVPVACITTIRLLLALEAIHNLVIHQMDVKTSFLNGDLNEEVYMKQPEGFVSRLMSIRRIKRENKGIVITQSHYIEKIFKKFNCEDCSPVSTSMDPVEKLKPNTGKPVDQLEYSRAIGCLMYAMTSTSQDIAYVVGRLSRFTSNPSRQH